MTPRNLTYVIGRIELLFHEMGKPMGNMLEGKIRRCRSEVKKLFQGSVVSNPDSTCKMRPEK